MYSLLAQVNFGDPETFAPAKIANISVVLNFVIPFITIAAAVVFLGMLLYAAFIWITAGSNAENVTKAWKIMSFAVLGLIMVIVSYLAIKLIGIFFGISETLPF